MKVCVVNPNYYRSGGVTVTIRRIHEAVETQGIDQYFVDCRYGDQEEDVDWMPEARLQSFRLMTKNPVLLFQQMSYFLRWLRENQIRVVHVHHRRLAALLHPFQGIANFRLIYTSHMNYPFEAWFWLLGPRLGVGISDSVAANLRETVRAVQVETIRNPIDFPDQCPLRLGGVSDPAVICIARLDPVKGHTHLIQAWKMLSDRHITAKLVLVGEGSRKEALLTQVRDNGLEHLVEFRGFQQNIAIDLDRCVFAVLASKMEGHPAVVIEAAAHGLPTLVTDVPGSRECVPPGAILPNLVPFGDAIAMADALSNWLEHPQSVVDEGRLFFDYHKARSSTSATAQLYADLYRSCVK